MFTQDVNQAIIISDAMETGTVQVNAAPARGPDHFPFQGFRDSGIGTQVRGQEDWPAMLRGLPHMLARGPACSSCQIIVATFALRLVPKCKLGSTPARQCRSRRACGFAGSAGFAADDGEGQVDRHQLADCDIYAGLIS